MSDWPAIPTGDETWRATRDTVHAHTQVLGKLAAVTGPAEPQLQHAALRLTARGWETRPMPAPDGSGAFVVALDLHRGEAVVEHSDSREDRVALTPNRAVGAVTRELLATVRDLAGPVEIDPTPQEVSWTVPLDRDEEHARFDSGHVARLHAAATAAGLVLAEFRAPFRGRSTPLNAWWGSFDLAVSLFSGRPADPPSDDFIMRNSMDAQEVAIGWWPGDDKYERAAFYSYAHPAPAGFAEMALAPAAGRWDATLGLYVLDWDDARATPDPHATALEFLHAVFGHACNVCDWDPVLAATARGTPPPVV
jgi:hypothetical protein